MKIQDVMYVIDGLSLIIIQYSICFEKEEVTEWNGYSVASTQTVKNGRIHVQLHTTNCQ